MKYFIIVSILWFSTEPTNGQTLETPASRNMIDNLKTVKPKPLAGFILPPDFKKGKANDTVHNKYLASVKKYGTFYLEGKPLKATTLLLNLNNKISSSPIEGILVFPHKTRSGVTDSLPEQTAKLLYSTDKGKVYALPQDNMPCIVPHINSNMPIAKLGMVEFKRIPNALPEQKIIPEKEIVDLPKKDK